MLRMKVRLNSGGKLLLRNLASLGGGRGKVGKREGKREERGERRGRRGQGWGERDLHTNHKLASVLHTEGKEFTQ